jgi:PAS domain S-box-containing protein
MGSSRRSLVASIAVAATAAAVAAWLRYALAPTLAEVAPYLPFVLAVAVAAWFGGLWPGLLTTALCCALYLYFFKPVATGSVLPSPTYVAALVRFIVSGAVISWLCESIRQSRQRRDAEQANRATADAFFEAIANLSSDFAYRGHFADDGTLINDEVTEGFTRVLGYTPAEVAALGGWKALVHPDDAPASDHSVEHIRAGETSEGDLRLRAKDGRTIWIHRHNRPLFDENGRVIGAYGAATDITRQKHAEESLRASEERLRLALEAGRMGVWDWNVLTDQLAWTEQLGPIFGLASGAFGGTFEAFMQLVHPDDRKTTRAAVTNALQGNSKYDIEFRTVWPDGSVRWVAVKGNVRCGADGIALRMLGVGMDVTDRRRAEEIVNLLLGVSTKLNSTLDLDELLDILVQEAIGLVGAESGVAGLCTSEGMVCHRYFQKGTAVPFEYCWPPMRGLPGWLMVHGIPYLTNDAANDAQIVHELCERFGVRSAVATPIVSSQGDVLGFFEIHNKIDGTGFTLSDRDQLLAVSQSAAIAVQNALAYRKLQEAERALQDADHRKEEFLATLAHELRNPLAPIRNAVEILTLKGGLAPELQLARDVILRQLGQMVHLVDDLLDISRISRNRLQIRKEPLELSTVIRNAVETSRPLIESLGHRLSVVLPAAPVHLEGDATRLAQVVSNLLNNAAKYTAPGGAIDLTSAQHDSGLTLTVRDSGIGIAREHLDGIFEMFSQVQPALERPEGGLGIGLSLVRRLVELHGGSVEARSDGPGHGSEFIVRLPVRETPTRTTTPVPRDAERPSRGGWRILVVDDNPDSAESLAQVLSLRGNDVCTAGDGPAAIAKCEEWHPDVVLLDIGLPGMNGFDVARHLRMAPRDHEMLLIAITGWGQDDDKQRSRAAGFDYHLVKPVEPATLEALLPSRPRAPAPNVTEAI